MLLKAACGIEKKNITSFIPATFGDDHFGAKLVESLPEFLRLQATLDVGQLATRGGGSRCQQPPSRGQSVSPAGGGGEGWRGRAEGFAVLVIVVDVIFYVCRVLDRRVIAR